MAKKRYDLIVIGSGSGALGAAFRIKNDGWKVAVIDSLPFGGTCAQRGCDPKKILVGAAEIIDRIERMSEKGISGSSKIKWSDLMKFKNTFTEPVPDSRTQSMKKAGIVPINGRAKFINENCLEVNGEYLETKKILLANGAKPVPLNIEGEEYLTYSDEFLALNELPENIIFVGGGYISFEFAHIAARAGSSVTILHRGEQPLEQFDKDLVGLLMDRTKEIGIDLQLNTDVNKIEKNGNEFIVHGKTNGEKQTYKGELVVHGAGRTPDIDDMDLDKGNVKFDKKGITVNEYMQSVSNENVYAAGDASGSPGLPLTPVAGMESRVAAHNILNGNKLKPDYTATSSVVFTLPSLASVGMREEEAKKQNIRYKINYQETQGWYSSMRIGEQHSAFKVLIDEENDTILGAHLLGDHYEEVINLFAMAIRFGIKTKELKKMIYAYPTRSSDVVYML